MSLRIDLTTHWSEAEMRPHWPEILACFQRYVERFETETVASILESIMRAHRQLWVVRDEAGKVVVAVITEVNVAIDGEVTVSLVEAGGERLTEALPLVSKIEQWAFEEKRAGSVQWWAARRGLERLVPRHGYKPHVAIFRKTRPEGAPSDG